MIHSDNRKWRSESRHVSSSQLTNLGRVSWLRLNPTDSVTSGQFTTPAEGQIKCFPISNAIIKQKETQVWNATFDCFSNRPLYPLFLGGAIASTERKLQLIIEVPFVGRVLLADGDAKRSAKIPFSLFCARRHFITRCLFASLYLWRKSLRPPSRRQYQMGKGRSHN